MALLDPFLTLTCKSLGFSGPETTNSVLFTSLLLFQKLRV